MFGIGKDKFARPRCELWDNTNNKVNYRSVLAAGEYVTREGLPIARVYQVTKLSGAMIDIAMTQCGLPIKPCGNCFDKSPVECPNTLTTDPESLDYGQIADMAIASLRQKADERRAELHAMDGAPQQ